MEENNIHKTNPLLDETKMSIHKGQPKKTRGKPMNHKSRAPTRTRTNVAVSNTSNGIGTKKR